MTESPPPPLNYDGVAAAAAELCAPRSAAHRTGGETRLKSPGPRAPTPPFPLSNRREHFQRKFQHASPSAAPMSPQKQSVALRRQPRRSGNHPILGSHVFHKCDPALVAQSILAAYCREWELTLAAAWSCTVMSSVIGCKMTSLLLMGCNLVAHCRRRRGQTASQPGIPATRWRLGAYRFCWGGGVSARRSLMTSQAMSKSKCWTVWAW